MKQTIEIEVPDGKKAVWKDGKVVFEDIKPQLPKTWKEFYKQNKTKDGECCLFPSKEQRDWSKFTAPWLKKERFDPKTLKPFDKVLVRDSMLVDGSPSNLWKCQILSHIKEEYENYPYVCINDEYSFCIPYNDKTKHLVGTKDEAPEYYRYWED